MAVTCGFAQLDLAVTQIISPAPGTSITDLQVVSATFVVTNDGSTTLNTGDTIFFRNELNGTTQSYTSGGQSFNVFFYLMTKTLAPNDTVHITSTLPVAWSYNSVTAGSSFTWGYNVRGTSCCPTLDDDDVTNNVFSVNLMADGGSVGIEEQNTVATEVYFNEGTLYVNGENLDGQSKIEVYNLLGQKVFETNLSESSFKKSYNLSNLTSGIYISTISDSNGKVIDSKKIMK